MSAETLPGPETVERALQALQTSETRLQQVLDNTSALVFAKDAHGRYIFVNREFERASGRPASEIIGRDDEAIFPPEFVARFRHNDLRVLHEGRSIEFEEVADFGSGPRTYVASKFPLFDADGKAYAVCGMATDITDRKRLEEALTVSALAVSQSDDEALYRQLVQYLATILDVEAAFIAVHDPREPMLLNMQAFYMDGQVRENFSYSQHGTPCATVVGKAFRLYPSGLAELFPLDVDFRKLRFESYAGHPLIDASGRPLGLIAAVSRRPLEHPAFVESVLRIFAVRVTAELERAAASQALRASEANYREIFEASDDAIFVHDWDTYAIVDANAKACEVCGYSKEEFQSISVGTISEGNPPYTQEDANAWFELAKREGSARYEWRRRCRGNELHWDEVRLKAVTIGGQRRILAITRDITERKQADEALRASEEQYRAVFNASTDGLVLWNSRFERVDVNPAYERIYGYDRAEVLAGGRARELPADHRQLQERIVAQTLAGEAYHGEFETVRRNGERFPVEVRTVPIQYRGEPHVLAMIRDITERQAAERRREHLESRLRQAQKMEAIGQLTGGIAHDFNNLLTTIMGYVTLAGERDTARDDARLGGYLGQAQRACERARDLIQQMLMFSRGQRGSPRVLRLDALVQDAVPTLRGHVASNVVVDLRIDPAPAVVRMDPVQVEQVLFNLVLNARDALAGSGRIGVEVRPVRVDTAVCAGCRAPIDGDYVELSVTDDGPGIDSATAERIFEPFFTTKETGKGTGMGLAIVHGIVHEHDGHVVLESAKGRGARFRVLLPAAAEAASAAASATPSSGGAARANATVLSGSVLVVDDEETVAHFMRELLESWGLQAECALRGDAALATIQANPGRFDAVVTDQAMPRMSGLELVRHVRNVRADLPVIVHTGNVDAMPALEEGGARPCAVLQKPVDPARLRSVLAQCLRRSPA
ncbi:MAG TPA: PAS domain S-box protein [Steroidobacteraceae bacterium]|nr:PAS domain S-box protein [Steroidobacteraceae bacterium]